MAADVLTLQPEQKQSLDSGFAASFGGAPELYFSAPGRTEIGGNHTDHQRGRVLAGAVNLDILLQETGRVFAAVLEDAGVYKNTDAGKNAFLRFVEFVNQEVSV